MPERFNITEAETDREAILMRERDDARQSAHTRGQGLRMAFVVIGLGFVLMLLLMNLYGDLHGDVQELQTNQRTGRVQRNTQQAERQFVNCFLGKDDFLAAERRGEDTTELHSICDRYLTLDESIATENSRRADGSLPDK